MRTEEEIKSDIESVNKCLNPLSLYKTKDLVKELISRDESTWMSVPETFNHKCLCVSIDDTLKETIQDGIVGSGQCIIIAVREFKL